MLIKKLAIASNFSICSLSNTDTPSSIISNLFFGNIDTCLDAIAKTHPNQTILFTGNGAQLHRDRIATKFGAHALFETTVTPHSNAMSVGNLAIKMLDQGFKGVKKLSPLYLKPNMGSTSGS